VKIELEPTPAPLRPPAHERRARKDPDTFRTPMKLLGWIIAILVLGPVCWWVVHLFQDLPPGMR